MAIKSGLFKSVNGDRRYNAAFFAEYFASFIANGVFPNPSTGLQIMANGDMTVSMRAGKAWINGYYFVNDSDYVLQLDVADGVLSRIDRIVLRNDSLTREIVPVVKKGVYASSPVAPTLQRDADAYEIALADILVSNGVVNITQANITDLRLNTQLCGIVHGTVNQVDTTTIFNQYQAWFNQVTSNVEGEIREWQAASEQQFMDWFNSLQDILDGDIAANLANKITLLTQEFTAHKSEKATPTTLGHVKAETDEEGNLILSASNVTTSDGSNVQTELDHLKSSVSDGKNLVETAITDKGGTVSKVGEVATFPELAHGVESINTGGTSLPNNAQLGNRALTAIDEAENYYMINYSPNRGEIYDKNFNLLKTITPPVSGGQPIRSVSKDFYTLQGYNDTTFVEIYTIDGTLISTLNIPNVGSGIGSLRENQYLTRESNRNRIYDFSGNVLLDVNEIISSSATHFTNRKDNFVVVNMSDRNRAIRIDKELVKRDIYMSVNNLLAIDYPNW